MVEFLGGWRVNEPQQAPWQGPLSLHSIVQTNIAAFQYYRRIDRRWSQVWMNAWVPVRTYQQAKALDNQYQVWVRTHTPVPGYISV
jgi:hypothetical protein